MTGRKQRPCGSCPQVRPEAPSLTSCRPAIAVCAAALLALAATPASAEEPAIDPEAPTAERVSWPALVEEMERTSPLMDAARAGLATFQAKLSRADWAYFPSFKIEGGAIPTPTIQGKDFDWTRWGFFYTVKASFVQPIYTFGRIAALTEAAEHGIDVGRAQVDAARWELRHRAAQAYHGALLAAELTALFTDGKKWLDKAHARMEKLRDEDSDDYDQLEHLRLKTRSSEFYQLEAENELLATQAHEGLRLLLSRPAGARVLPVEDRLQPISLPLHPVQTYLDLARRTQPRVRMAEAGAAAHEALADAEFSNLWPNLAFTGEIGISDSNVINADSEVLGGSLLGPTGGLLIGLSWNLDVPQQLGKANEARAKAAKARSEARVAHDLMELEVRRLHQQLTGKQRLLGHVRGSMKAAQGWLNATWDLYDSDFGSFQDVLDALVQFYGKKVGYLRLVHEHNTLVWELCRAIGADITTLEPPEPDQETP